MISEIFKAVADGKTRLLIDSIQLSSNNSNENSDGKIKVISITKYGLTRRQYYERVNNLLDVGIIAKLRGAGQYRLTAFGEILYHYMSSLEAPASENNLWKIKIIDSVIYGNNSIKKEEVESLINALIDNPEIKEFI